jgi:hypothetical protein
MEGFMRFLKYHTFGVTPAEKLRLFFFISWTNARWLSIAPLNEFAKYIVT